MEIKDYKKKIRELKKEIQMLENFISIAQPEEWDMEGVYSDTYYGTFNGNDIGGTEEPELAEWIRKRYNLDKIEDED